MAHNVAVREEVDRIVDVAASAGAEVTKAPVETFYGGYAGFFRDPDGHVWEVAYNPGFTLAGDGSAHPSRLRQHRGARGCVRNPDHVTIVVADAANAIEFFVWSASARTTWQRSMVVNPRSTWACRT